jgi:16S rRNA (adenine1518-N6/adenine1519-N6)-dimethyltransferase
MIQTWCRAESLFRIRPGAFQPAPKVESAFLRLTPHRPPRYRILDSSFHARLVAKAFSQRRKTLRNSLNGMIGQDQLAALGVDPGQRAEELTVSTFAALANAACKSARQP